MKNISAGQIILSLIIFFLVLNFRVFGQENCLSDTTHTSILQDINHGLNDGVELIKSPFHFTPEEWLYTGGLVGLTAGSFFIDESIRKVVAKNHNGTMDNITEIGHKYGNAGYMVILSGAAYLTGKIIKNNDISETSRMILETLAYAGIITTVIKAGLGRARPYTGNGAFDFFNFKLNNDFISFPSGHSTTAFAVSSVLAAKINNIYASIALYGLAGLTLYQRIYSDNHWFSDTFAGAVISTVIGNAIVKLNECPEKRSRNSLIVLPAIQANSMGLSLIYSF
ncbi:MAG: phosphatase PAP2 family protein [Ignavibacteriaceae bacterium]